MVNAAVQTEACRPAPVIGIEQDALLGVRVRKSFGSRVFWGSVVACYWIAGGLFYKVTFDDGDVDIFSLDEVMQDVMAAKNHPNEESSNRFERDPSSSTDTALADYFPTMRQHTLKRKRDQAVDLSSFRTRRVYLWGQRLYASIFTNGRKETFIKEMLKTEEGEMGEIEATGQVEVGDMILAVNGTKVLGMSSKELAELLRKTKRPIVLTLYRPHEWQIPTFLQPRAQNRAPAVSNSSTTTPTLPLQSPQTSPPAQSVPTTPYAAINPIQQSYAAPIVSAPFVVSPAPHSLTPGMPNQWMNTTVPSQPQTLSIMEQVRRKLVQNVAARQANHMPGYSSDMFGNIVPGGGMAWTHNNLYQPHQIQYMQNVVHSAAMRLASQHAAPVTQSGRPAQFPLASVPQNPLQREKVHDLVQQMETVHGRSRPASQSSSAQAAPSTTSSVISSSTSKQASLSLEMEEIASEMLAARQQRTTVTNVSSKDSNCAEPSTLLSSSSAVGTEIATADGVETIARQGKEPSQTNGGTASGSASPNSLVSPDEEEPVNVKAGEEGSRADTTEEMSMKRELASAVESMSFLSPSDFNVATESTAVELSGSLVQVSVFRRRLYLTLGIQGTLIAVTSFVKDENGKPGEVEASGKVFHGDVLVRINETLLGSGLTPGHVADLVVRSPRPMTLWFQRASWDILDGRA